MKRYDAYKDSGVEWLGEVPEHWKISHLNRFCTKITDGAHTSPDLSSNDYPFLTVVNLNNGILDFENCLFTSYIDYEKLVRNGCQPKKYDVLYSKDGTISETAVINEDRNFVVGSSFIIVRPNLKMSNSFYLCYFLTSAIICYQARIYVKGASLPRISIFNIAKLISVVPSLPEQQSIANYLNIKTAQIDRKIYLLTQKATQYGKLKQSLINETVTRGLDKTVAMKDSGVEWIGEVPEHWTTLRVKDTVIKIGNGVTPKGGSEVYTDVGIPFIRSQNVYDDGLHIGDVSFISDEIHRDMKGSQLKEGDILINITGASIGRTCVVPIELGIANINQHVAFLRTKCWFNTTYISLFLKSPFIKKYIQFEQNGASKEAFNLTQIANIPIVVPNVEEQTAIATYLDTKTTHIDRIIETINAQIEKLKELRKTLINDVVTGKIKVVE